MDAIETIKTRRSIRSFEDRPVPDEIIRQVLEAAMFAPSAGNEQPWQFVVVTDRKLLAQIPQVNPYAGSAARAPLAIMVCGDLSLEMYGGFWVQDCAAAAQNLLLAAHALGLGAVWTGVYPREERVQGFRRLFGLPEKVVPFALVILGWPAERPVQPDRYRETRVHHNGW